MSTCSPMNQIRWVTPDFAVSPQIDSDTVAEAAAKGFKTIMNNRPDGEALGQPKGDDIAAAAAAHGLEYRSLPFVGPPPPVTVDAMSRVLQEAPGPVLAYCRTGSRSIMAWAMAQALSGTRSSDELITLAKNAGYDLSRTREALEALSPRQ